MADTKLLSDSLVFTQAIAAINANVTQQITTGLAANFSTLLTNLPDEADGDPRPTTGPYLSGGVLKVA